MTLFPNKVTFSDTRDWGFNLWIWVEDTIQPITTRHVGILSGTSELMARRCRAQRHWNSGLFLLLSLWGALLVRTWVWFLFASQDCGWIIKDKADGSWKYIFISMLWISLWNKVNVVLKYICLSRRGKPLNSALSHLPLLCRCLVITGLGCLPREMRLWGKTAWELKKMRKLEAGRMALPVCDNIRRALGQVFPAGPTLV